MTSQGSERQDNQSFAFTVAIPSFCARARQIETGEKKGGMKTAKINKKKKESAVMIFESHRTEIIIHLHSFLQHYSHNCNQSSRANET